MIHNFSIGQLTMNGIKAIQKICMPTCTKPRDMFMSDRGSVIFFNNGCVGFIANAQKNKHVLLTMNIQQQKYDHSYPQVPTTMDKKQISIPRLKLLIYLCFSHIKETDFCFLLWKVPCVDF